MSLKLRALLLCVMAWTSLSAHAYVQLAHKAMTDRAFDRAHVDLVRHLGTPRDVAIMKQIPVEWMKDGAYDEDRIIPDLRSLHHFFDPTQMRALTVSCQEVGTRADLWALDPLPLGNTYAVRDAKLHYSDAVLGVTPAARAEGARDLFVTLGHVVHMVQDMAQPEHTRNDQHLPYSDAILQNGTSASVWEDWGINLVNPETAPVSFDGYPNVDFPEYASYFHTADVRDGRPAGKGLADYANLNFVTQDTNYHDENLFWHCPSSFSAGTTKCFFHTEPRIEEAARRTVKSAYAVEQDGIFETVEVEEDIFTSFPRDNRASSSEADPFHTFLSSLDHETAQFGCDRLYSLGEGSYLSRAALLVPRAVGYSAGLIEHFFRGNIDASWKEMPDGTYQLTITNLSSEWLGNDASIEAVYRATPAYLNQAGDVDTAPIITGKVKDLIPGFAGLYPHESVTIPNVQPLTLHAGDKLTQFERRIVVTGTLGTEPETIIGLVQAGAQALVVDMTVVCDIRDTIFSVWEFGGPNVSQSDLFTNQVLSLVWQPGTQDPLCSDSSKPRHVPNTCIEHLPSGGITRAARITMNNFDPAKRYVFSAYASGNTQRQWLPSCSGYGVATLGGQIVQQYDDYPGKFGNDALNGVQRFIVYPEFSP